MAARDSRFFKLIFQPNGVIAQFHRTPERRYVVIDRRYFGKRPTLKLLRYILPRYRVYREDNQLVEELYQNQNIDTNIRRLILQPEPVLSDAHHKQLEEVDKLPEGQKELAQDRAIEKVISEASKKPAGSSSVAGDQSAAVEEAERIVTASRELSEEKSQAVSEAQRIVPQVGQIETPSTLKTLSANLGIKAKEITSKYLTTSTVANLVSAGVGGVTGFGVLGLPGAAAGAGAGVIISQYVAHGGGNTLLRKGGSAAERGATLLSAIAQLPLTFLSLKKFVLIGVLTLVAIPLLGFKFPSGGTSSVPVIGGGTIPVGAVGCPTQAIIEANKLSPDTCRYLNPSIDLFNTSISQHDIVNYTTKYSPIFVSAQKGDVAEFRKRVNYIVTNSKAAGLNPAIFLGYWKTESNFSTTGNRDMGCLGDNFYEQVDCALGINDFYKPDLNPIPHCARSKSAESIACKALKGVRAKPNLDPINPIKYPISTFDDFAESYGPRAPDFDGPDVVNNNCVSTYNKLLEVAVELNMCSTLASCPVPGGKITTPSIDANPATGHCGAEYVKTGFICPTDNPNVLPTQTRRAKSIDVVGATKGPQDAYLPTIAGKSVNWRYLGPLVISASDCEEKDKAGKCGVALIFQTEVADNHTWTIHFFHMVTDLAAKFATAPSGTIYPSGTKVGQTAISHLHTTIGQDVKDVTARYDPGWLASDFMCSP